MEHLHANEFEAFHLKPLDDLSDDAPLHAIGLDGDECALQLFVGHDSETKQKKKKGDEGRIKYNLQRGTSLESHSRLVVAVSGGASCGGPRPHCTVNA